MAVLEEGNLLHAPSGQNYAALERASTSYKPHETYALEKEKHYQQQFADIYFLRLTKLKPAVEKIASDAWEDFQIAGETVERVDRVLDVRQGKLCWVIGTIYMEMPLKPNILDDISKDHWISAPPHAKNTYHPQETIL
ncbi:DNA polymerase subunit delta-2 [Lachnellula arida]|uniref:DNA polymerase subunit delta-2 n=1 Tax=Lachnellula arida TaxID=1316785 RepID=A0A8T9B3J3_9HELO|nr:DNA polymerase subunit delta-2 [Lachnellula arida]